MFHTTLTLNQIDSTHLHPNTKIVYFQNYYNTLPQLDMILSHNLKPNSLTRGEKSPLNFYYKYVSRNLLQR